MVSSRPAVAGLAVAGLTVATAAAAAVVSVVDAAGTAVSCMFVTTAILVAGFMVTVSVAGAVAGAAAAWPLTLCGRVQGQGLAHRPRPR